jgi:uncharacterized membrane protein
MTVDHRRNGALAQSHQGNGHQDIQHTYRQAYGRTTQDRTSLATALGWLSVGLGLAEVLAPEEVAEWVGVNNDDETLNVVRAIGLRELVSGVGILTQSRPRGWLLGRFAGDCMDLLLLSRAQGSDKAQPGRINTAMAAVIGIGLLDLYGSQQGSHTAAHKPEGIDLRQGITVRKTITIQRTPDELYRFWRDFQNLPQFMQHLESVEVIDNQRSRWTAKAPAGMMVSWEAEIVDDQPDERITWRSLPGSDVTNAGLVRFITAPGGRGTEVHVTLRYSPPAGQLGAIIAKLLGEEPAGQVADDLRRLKQVMELGEVVVSDATVHGNQFFQRTAEPTGRRPTVPIRP